MLLRISKVLFRQTHLESSPFAKCWQAANIEGRKSLDQPHHEAEFETTISETEVLRKELSEINKRLTTLEEKRRGTICPIDILESVAFELPNAK